MGMGEKRLLRFVVLVVSALLLLEAVPVCSSQGGDIIALAIDPLTPTTLYAATDGGGLFKTTDGGASWNATGLTNISVLALAIDPLTPTTLYAGVYGGLFKSADGGASWSATGLTGIDVYSLAIDLLTPTTLYAGTNGAVHKSTDGGASWNATGDLLAYARVSSVVVDFVTPTTLYAAINVLSAGWYGSPTGPTTGGIYKSTNGGATWSLISSFDPTINDGSGGQGFSCGPCGGVLALAIDPSISTTFFAVTDGLVLYNYWGDVVVWTQPGFVMKGTDGGRNWSTPGIYPWPDVIDPFPIPGLAIAPRADPLTPTTLYVGSTDVFKSTDGGASFSPTGLTGAGSALSLAIDPRFPTTIYAGTPSASVFKSMDGGASWNPTGPIAWLHISSWSLNPASVIGPSSSTGTVTLSAAAPAGGAAIILTSSNPAVATVPASVVVPAGATSADFTVSTNPVPVGASTTVAIRGLYGGALSSATLTVTLASALSALSLNPSSVPGGAASIGTVTLSAAAPAGGAEVPLSSSNAAVATVPASVTVPAGSTSANFTVSTSLVTSATSATIQAANFSVVLNVIPATTLSLLSLSPASVTAGNSSTGTVTLSAAAPTSGAVVTLASSETAVAMVPASVTVAAGATSATFTVSTSSQAGCASSLATISATYGSVTRSAGLTVTPATDTVAIQQADYFASRHELRVAATSTGSTSTLQVYVTSTGDLIGALKHYDGNRYSGRFTWPVNPQNITVRSRFCGSATRAVSSR
ncbi:MAG: hypothetical protein DMD87_03420 [Candidatus Rokuibacteriota bacterium]|nr:MAG: hypothetical protein DMD87_03420 [Candidatus Rokubacteria bacterium]